MNRILRGALLVLITLVSFSTLQAKVVDRSEAMQTATNFLRSHSSVATLSAAGVKEVWNSNQLSATGVATVSAMSAPTFYVFAPETGTGFVIVSGDDATESILGYSDESAFETEDMPCCFLSWCEAMDKQITHYRETGTVSARKAARESGIATLASETVELNTATWGQGAPFYNDCPTYSSTRCVTGCVSTSFAIAMYYHKHPTTGTGQTEAYTTETNSIYVASRDLSSHTYDWSNMLDSYTDSYTDTQASAVATLMADIGAALQADYTTDGTGTGVGMDTSAEFYEHFGYAPNIFFATSSNYDEDSWTALMEDQIKNVGPVPYACMSMVHQFILDGYDNDDKFHINWGWNGYDNGWYLLPEIETGDNTQYAFVDFAPDDGNEGCVLKMIQDGISASVTTFQQNGQFTMGGLMFVNYSPIYFTGNLCYVLTDSEGNIKEYISPELYVENIEYLGYSGADNITCVIESDISEGDRIRVVYKDGSVDHWKLLDAYDPSNTVDYIEMTSSNIGVPLEYEYSVQMYDTGLTTSATEFAKNASFNVNATIANLSSKTIDNCYFKVAFCDEDGNVKEWISDEWTLSAFESYYYIAYGNISCVIRGDIEAGDRIRMFYQVDNNIEGHWKLIEGNGNAPWEIVISEDQIGDPVTPYNISVYSNGVTVSKNTFYTGVSFNTNVTFVSWDEAVNVMLKVALVGSDGVVKEWLSEEVDKGQVYAKVEWSSGDILCTITGDVEAGDIIRPYYQGEYDGDWWMFGEYGGAPRQVEITEDMAKEPTRVIENGEYLLVDTGGYYFGGGLTWGTQASTIGKPQFFGFEMQDDYTYHLDSHQYTEANKHYLGTNLYVDAEVADWTLEEVEGGYTIYGNGGYLTSNGFQTAATLETEPYVWKLVTKDEVIASMSEATADYPVDVTALIAAPELKRNINTTYYPTWTVTGYDGTGTANNCTFGYNNSAGGNCAESYHSNNGFNISQELTLPLAGTYTLSAQGFYRDDYTDGTTPVPPVMYAGDHSVELMNLYDAEGETSSQTSNQAMTMATAYHDFLLGFYPAGPITITAKEDGETVTIGFKGADTSLWNCMGELELLYYGVTEEINYTNDVTWKLANPSFEVDNVANLTVDETRGNEDKDGGAWTVTSLTGWDLVTPAHGNSSYPISDLMAKDATGTDNDFGAPGEPTNGTYMLYLRNAHAEQNSNHLDDASVMQTITLPAGDYNLTVDSKCVATDANAGTVTLVVGKNSKALTIHTDSKVPESWDTAELAFSLTAETELTVGVNIVFTDGSTNYPLSVLLDNFKLYTAIDEDEEYEEKFKETIEWEMTSAKWGTMILPFDYAIPTANDNGDEATLTLFAGDAITVNGTELALVGTAATSIAANTPYLVSGTAGKYTFTGVPTNTQDSYTVGVLTGTFVELDFDKGAAFTHDGTEYLLQNHEEGDVAGSGVGFYPIKDASTGATLDAYHCYLTVTAEDTDDGTTPAMLSLGFTGEETGIVAVEGTEVANDAIYDLSGRKVSKAAKGLYIMNGKKVLVK